MSRSRCISYVPIKFWGTFLDDESKSDLKSSNFLGEKILTRAAVDLEAGKLLEVMGVKLDGLRSREVLVEIRAIVVCYTDEFIRSWENSEGIFITTLGHEGAGFVIKIGKSATSLEVGGHVIPLYAL